MMYCFLNLFQKTINYILPKLTIDSKSNKSSTLIFIFKYNGHNIDLEGLNNISQTQNDLTVKSFQI